MSISPTVVSSMMRPRVGKAMVFEGAKEVVVVECRIASYDARLREELSATYFNLNLSSISH